MDLTLTLAPQEMQLVWNALMEVPGKHAYALAKKMEAQLARQGAFSEPGQLPKGKTDETSDATGG